MKIRKDFVTNSSSTSFGTAAATGFISAILSTLGLSSAYAASEAAEELPKDSEGASGPDRDFNPQTLVESDIPLEEKMKKIDREIAEYEKEWQENKDSYEGDDYQAKKKEYDEYKEYLESQKERAEYIEYEKEVEKVMKEAEAEYKKDWIDHRKEDLKEAREQIEMIEATIRGYGKSGYDVEEAKAQLEMYKAKERDLDKALKKEGVDFDYQAKEREDIGPSKVMQEKMAEIDAEYQRALDEIRQEKIIERKKEIIRRNQKAWEEESRAHSDFANLADRYKKAAEIIQMGADIGVDILEKVTGPVGKTIKKAYVGGKGLGSGVGEAWADPANASSHIVKGAIKGAGDVAKEFTDSQLVKDGIGYVSEISQGGIESYQKGEDITKGMGKGFGRATIDTVVDRGANKFFGPLAEVDAGSTPVKSLLKSLKDSDSPVRKALVDSAKENLSKQAINQAKNDWKGQGMVSSDWSMMSDFTGTI